MSVTAYQPSAPSAPHPGLPARSQGLPLWLIRFVILGAAAAAMWLLSGLSHPASAYASTPKPAIPSSKPLPKLIDNPVTSAARHLDRLSPAGLIDTTTTSLGSTVSGPVNTTRQVLSAAGSSVTPVIGGAVLPNPLTPAKSATASSSAAPAQRASVGGRTAHRTSQPRRVAGANPASAAGPATSPALLPSHRPSSTSTPQLPNRPMPAPMPAPTPVSPGEQGVEPGSTASSSSFSLASILLPDDVRTSPVIRSDTAMNRTLTPPMQRASSPAVSPD